MLNSVKFKHHQLNWMIISLTFIALFPALSKGQTDLTTMKSCYTCLQTTTNYVCKDNFGESISYCCSSSTSTARMCNRNFCSKSAISQSLKWYTCPYEQRTCGSTTSKLVADLGSSYSISTNSALYAQNSVCFWTIQSRDLKDGTTPPTNSWVEIRATKI